MAHAKGKRNADKSVTVIGWTYVGGGDYLIGIPARDLTIDEYDRHIDEIQANAEATGRPLYVPLTKEEEG